jgi:hypothetical protein
VIDPNPRQKIPAFILHARFSPPPTENPSLSKEKIIKINLFDSKRKTTLFPAAPPFLRQQTRQEVPFGIVFVNRFCAVEPGLRR